MTGRNSPASFSSIQAAKLRSRRSTRSLHRCLAIAAAGCLTFGVACRNDGDANEGQSTDENDPHASADEQQYLKSVVERVFVPTLTQALDQSTKLRIAAQNYERAVHAQAPDLETTTLAVHEAFTELLRSWERLEMMQLGPALTSTQSPSGLGLRDEILSWPVVNPCRVDQVIVSQAYLTPDFVATQLVNAYGLDALSYLLYYTGAQNQCAPQLEINQGAWQAIDALELAKRRASYARVVSEQVEAAIVQLHTAWAEPTLGFAQQLVNAGVGSTEFRTTQAAMNAVFAALFYLDLKTKDQKLGAVLGLNGQCATGICLQNAQWRWSEHSGAAITANLEAASQIYWGDVSAEAGIGLDDILTARGLGDVATTMSNCLIQAQQAAAALVPSWSAEPESTQLGLEPLYAQLKSCTDLLKGPIVMGLQLQVPQEGAGDND